MRDALVVVVLALLAACGDGASPALSDAAAGDAGADAGGGGATFTATPPELIFNALVGTTSHQSVVFANTSATDSAALSLALGGSTTAPFAIETTTCTGALAAGATCTAAVAYTASGATTSSATLTLTDGAASVVVPLTGTGSNTAGLSAAPTLRDFGTVGVGATSSSFTFTITNVGTAPTTALAVAFQSGASGDFVLANNLCAGAIVAAQASCTIAAALVPTAVGPRTATLKISDPASGAQVIVTLTGQGTSPPAGLVFSPAAFDFGLVHVGDSAIAHQFTLMNTSGAVTGSIAITKGGANLGDFLLMADGCNNHTLAAGASCTLFVSFEPGAAGGRNAAIIATATPGGSATANVTGTGQ